MSEVHRVRLVPAGSGLAVDGWACPNGCFVSASYAARCPSCAATLSGSRFGPGGVIWSVTTIRIPSTELAADRAIAYVDLDAGPRIVCDVADGDLTIGRRVQIRSASALGTPEVIEA